MAQKNPVGSILLISSITVFGILLGLGGASLMPEDSPWRWLLGVGGGLFSAGAALAYLLWPILKTGIPRLRQRAQSGIARLWSKIPVVRLQKGFPWVAISQRAAASAPSPADAQPSPPGKRRAIPWEFWQGLLVGISLLLPALAARLLGMHSHGYGNLLVIYFSTPAILLWAGGQAAGLYPHWVVRPKHLPQVSGLLGGAMQLLSALLLWVHLGMDTGIEVSSWMFWLALALAAGGMFFNLTSQMAQAQAVAQA